MKTISLTKGRVAIIDDDVYEWASKFKWHINKHGYAARNTVTEKGRTISLMHREILGAPVGCLVDHIDQNPINNLKENLRLCTRSENGMNRRTPKNNSSGFKGVSLYKRRGTYSAQICLYGRRKVHLGYFASAIDASAAYEAAAKSHHGEFYCEAIK